jgi:hypothetical protein
MLDNAEKDIAIANGCLSCLQWVMIYSMWMLMILTINMRGETE